MMRRWRDPTRWLIVVAFAVGMAWVESATVYYLRVLVGRVEPYQPNPLPLNDAIGQVELVREAATLLMLLTVGMLADRSWHKRFAYSAIAFGVWDVCYYVFLLIMTGWPRTLLDWDILFLLPLPWWGPILAPVLIAVLMIVWGTCATQSDIPAPTRATKTSWSLGWAGILLALYVFMADAIRALPGGRDAVMRVLPVEFPWPLFLVALALMAAPLGPYCRVQLVNWRTGELVK